jgi:hypothetical protein
MRIFTANVISDNMNWAHPIKESSYPTQAIKNYDFISVKIIRIAYITKTYLPKWSETLYHLVHADTSRNINLSY